MNLVNRVKNMLITPKTEWVTIESENTSHAKLFFAYVLPLALIPAIAAFIGYGLIGHSYWGGRVHSISWGVRQAVSQLITMCAGTYIAAFVIYLLADTFNSKKDFNKAFELVAYAYTPMFVGGIFYIYPSISWLASLCGIYGLYLLYIGLQPIMVTPNEKKTGYFVVSLLVMAAAVVVLGLILSALLIGSAYSVASGLRF